MQALAPRPVELLLSNGIQRTHSSAFKQSYGAAKLMLNTHSSAFKQRYVLNKHSNGRLVRKRRLVTAALPVVSGIPVLGPVANLILSPTILLAAYCIGAVRFWQGYPRTTYTGSMKLVLTLMWPALFVVSKAFRDNFKKAVS